MTKPSKKIQEVLEPEIVESEAVETEIVDEINEDISVIDTLQAELTEIKNKWLRAEAEIANVRTRARKDVDEARQYAIQKFAKDIIESAENLKRGIDSIDTTGDTEAFLKLYDGLLGIEKHLIATLERNGIKRLDPTGNKFDANLHEAMTEKESDEHTPGTVLESYTHTWTLNGRLLKPAMVVVSKTTDQPKE